MDGQKNRPAYILHRGRDRKESGGAPGSEEEGRRQPKNNGTMPSF